MPIELIYFDLGNVLLTFDHDLAARQMAEVAQVSEETVRRVVFEEGLQERFERGDLTTGEFFDSFCQLTRSQPDRADLLHAGSNMFQLNVPVIPVVAHLRAAGYRLGILSNTCQPHWDFVNGRFAILQRHFDPRILSFRAGASKPERKIFQLAREAAGIEPAKLLFIDDRAENVTSACEAGLDAVQYTTPSQLISDLAQRGVRFNL